MTKPVQNQKGVINICTRIAHSLFPALCVKGSEWINGELRCRCGDVLALRYYIDQVPRMYIYQEFRKYQRDIIAKHNAASMDNSIGAIVFDDFRDFMEEMKQLSLHAYPSEEDLQEPAEENKEDTYIG